jgi:hypothetical protein
VKSEKGIANPKVALQAPALRLAISIFEAVLALVTLVTLNYGKCALNRNIIYEHNAGLHNISNDRAANFTRAKIAAVLDPEVFK